MAANFKQFKLQVNDDKDIIKKALYGKTNIYELFRNTLDDNTVSSISSAQKELLQNLFIQSLEETINDPNEDFKVEYVKIKQLANQSFQHNSYYQYVDDVKRIHCDEVQAKDENSINMLCRNMNVVSLIEKLNED